MKGPGLVWGPGLVPPQQQMLHVLPIRLKLLRQQLAGVALPAAVQLQATLPAAAALHLRVLEAVRKLLPAHLLAVTAPPVLLLLLQPVHMQLLHQRHLQLLHQQARSLFCLHPHPLCQLP